MHNFYLIGHRGAAGEKFENSLSSFEHALALELKTAGIDGIFTGYPSKLLSIR
jgi:glycerophosphoryl diester phosphodiesterase